MSSSNLAAGIRHSASVAELVKGMTAALIASKIKLATVMLLTMSLLTAATSGSLVFLYGRASEPLAATSEPLAAKVDAEQKAAPTKNEPAKPAAIQGCVLGPDGQPKAGAKILLLGENQQIAELGVTAADGRFAVAVPKAAKGRLIARTEDAGIDFVSAGNLKADKSIEMRLVKDRPICGQVVTTEGKPVADARVAVRIISVYANNSLDSFQIAWAKRRGNSEMPGGVKALWPEGAEPFAAATDADGRFAIRGIGAERVVLLRFSGPGIASTERYIVNRPIVRAWANGLRSDGNWPVRLNGDCCPAYALEAGKPRLMVFYDPSKKLAGSLRLTADEKEPIVAKLGAVGSIRGRLLDAEGKPLAGVAVDARYRDDEAGKIHAIIHKTKQAVTDKNGSFTLDELIPEMQFELSLHRGKRSFERETKPADSAVRIKPGQRRDLGAIQVRRVPE